MHCVRFGHIEDKYTTIACCCVVVVGTVPFIGADNTRDASLTRCASGLAGLSKRISQKSKLGASSRHDRRCCCFCFRDACRTVNHKHAERRQIGRGTCEQFGASLRSCVLPVAFDLIMLSFFVRAAYLSNICESECGFFVRDGTDLRRAAPVCV